MVLKTKVTFSGHILVSVPELVLGAIWILMWFGPEVEVHMDDFNPVQYIIAKQLNEHN